jgi:hypothetical protein
VLMLLVACFCPSWLFAPALPFGSSAVLICSWIICLDLVWWYCWLCQWFFNLHPQSWCQIICTCFHTNGQFGSSSGLIQCCWGIHPQRWCIVVVLFDDASEEACEVLKGLHLTTVRGANGKLAVGFCSAWMMS